MSDECSSYVHGSLTCRDGFVQVANCRRPELCKCGSAYVGKAPPCLMDELPEHLSREDGSPLFYPTRTIREAEEAS